LFIICGVFYSCNNHVATEPDCFDLVVDLCDLPDIDNGPWESTVLEYDSLVYHSPCFNPNDNSEFIFIEENKFFQSSNLCKFDLTSGIKTLLADGASGSPQWSIKDWIIFNRGAEIWKIKSDGDSISALFDAAEYYDPEISPVGDKFIFRRVDDYYTTLISTMDGAIIASLSDLYFGEASWSPDGEKIACKQVFGTGTFGYYNTSLTLFTPIIDNDSGTPYDFVTDTEWFPDSKNIFWFGSGKYSITNIETGETTSFSEYCDQNFNMYPSFSADGSKIIWEKTKKSLLDDCEGYHISTSIVITDIDGSNEETILE